MYSVVILLVSLFWISGLGQTIYAQEESKVIINGDTLQAVSLGNDAGRLLAPENMVIDTNHYEPTKLPYKAAMYSAVLPGLGQAYNGRYWKIPIVYAFIGVSTAMYFKWQNEYSRFRRAYIDFNDNNPMTNYWKEIGFPDYYTDAQISQSIDRGRSLYRSWRDWSILAIVISYSLNVMEANVNAHLLDFNIEDDVSLHIQPCILPSPMIAQHYIGINFHLSF